MRLLFFLIALITLASCARIDNTRPTINQMLINTIEADSIGLANGDITVTYLVSDNEEIVDSRVRCMQLNSGDSGFVFLDIRNVNAGSYSGEVNFSIPDSIQEPLTYFNITVDAFDNSANQAIQRSTIIFFK